MAYVVVFGNEKGGTGKSTTAMHVLTALLKLGYTVGSIDIDARQGTLSRYIHNRKRFGETQGLSIQTPTHVRLEKSARDSISDAENEDKEAFEKAFHSLSEHNDFIVIDTPGHDLYLSRLAHSYADTLITPLNDSFIDLDVLAEINADNLAMVKPSIYANWVWEQKKQRAVRDRGSIDWIILRNRLSTLHSKNKEHMLTALEQLAKRLSFRFLPGFSERVIFRELFTQGLTLLDLSDLDRPMTLSHIAAKLELRSLMEAINLPSLKQALAERY